LHTFVGGHTNTERGYLPTLATKLQAELQVAPDPDLGDIDVVISEADADPLQFV
jgi:putative NIF3 family GTP cyclohydrolase 1 type 2